MQVHYRVRATLPSSQVRDEYIAWLTHGHLQAVKRAGASDARLILIDPDPADPRPIVESHYTFPSRAAFDSYLATAAPALRAEGLAKFPPDCGIHMQRALGSIMTEPS